MERKRWLAAGVAVLAVAIVPLVASASSVDTKLQIGFSLHFTGPTSSAGTFVASGAVRDSGTSVATDLAFDPLGNQDDARLTGTQMFVGSHGTITITARGIAGPLSDPHEAGVGTFEIVSGTGDYAGLTGHGTFLVVVDLTTNQIIGTVTGQAN